MVSLKNSYRESSTVLSAVMMEFVRRVGPVLCYSTLKSNLRFVLPNGFLKRSISTEEKPLLYSYWRSSCSWRVRIALAFKEIPYEMTNVRLGQHLTEEYRAVNPILQVPSLVIDGYTLIESLNILHYLEETRPNKPLMPKDAYERAKVRTLCEMVQSGIQPLQNRLTLECVGEERGAEWANYWISRGFKAIEKILTSTSGKYSVGDEITMADCFLIPQVYNARRYNVSVEPYPTLIRIDRELENHPAFVISHPTRQPDYPPGGAKTMFE